MHNRLYILLISIVLMQAACKKDAQVKITDQTLDLSRVLDFKASASSHMTISVIVIRPTGLASGVTGIQTEGVGSENIVDPYEYKSTKIQVGDQVVVQVYAYSEQNFKSLLTVNEVNIPYTSITHVNGDIPAKVTWQFVVK
jgi:hypothetical protein